MKVTVGADGEVVFDTEDVAQAVAMVKALRNGTAPEPKRPSHKKAKPVNTDKSLPEGMGAVWSFLVAHDTPEGVAAAAIATGLGLTRPAAAARLQALQAKGLAYRVIRGRYRPGEDPATLPDPDPLPEQPPEPPASNAPVV